MISTNCRSIKSITCAGRCRFTLLANVLSPFQQSMAESSIFFVVVRRCTICKLLSFIIGCIVNLMMTSTHFCCVNVVPVGLKTSQKMFSVGRVNI